MNDPHQSRFPTSIFHFSAFIFIQKNLCHCRSFSWCRN